MGKEIQMEPMESINIELLPEFLGEKPLKREFSSDLHIVLNGRIFKKVLNQRARAKKLVCSHTGVSDHVKESKVGESQCDFNVDNPYLRDRSIIQHGLGI